MNIVYRKIIKETIDSINKLNNYITDKNFKCFTDITYQRAIDIIKGPDMCKSEFIKKINGLFNYGAGSQSMYSINFWIYRGWTSEESSLKVTEIQKSNSNKYVNKLKSGELMCTFSREYLETIYDKDYVDNLLSAKAKHASLIFIQNKKLYPTLYVGYNNTSIEYYLKKGYSEEESKKLLSERQSTFSLEKCISKHGKDEGTKIFNQRQEKWLNTLNNKPQEEIDDINSRKAITLDNMIKKYGEEEGREKYYSWSDSKNPGIINKNDILMPGKLYYIHFYNDELQFWKIGITNLTVENGRFAKNDVFFNKYNLNYKIIFEHEYNTYYECFEKEQFILRAFRKNRCTIDYNGFKTTEAFKINILKEFIK